MSEEGSVFHLLCESSLQMSPLLQNKLEALVREEALQDYMDWFSPSKSSERSDICEGIIKSIQQKEVGDFINWKLDHVKRLLEVESNSTRALQHADVVLNNVLPKDSKLDDEQLCLALFLRNKALLFSKAYSEAIQSSSFRSAQNITQLRLQSEDRNYFIPDFLDEENEKILGSRMNVIKSSAKVIVDPNGTKGVNASRQFVVNDIQTALKIAQNSDVIFIEKGSYDCSKASGKTLQISKSVSLVGSSKSEVKLCGSIVKWESCGSLTLDNLQIEVNEETKESGSVEDIYLLGGKTQILGCVIESSANTAIYVMGSSEGTTTELNASYSIFDGLEECRRMICPKGSRISISVDNCYASDSLSFLTLIDPEDHHAQCSYSFKDSMFSHVQDVIHLFPMKTSNYTISVTGCIFDVSTRDEDVKSVGLHLEGASRLTLRSNKFSLYDLDSSAVHLRNVLSAAIEMNICELLTGSRPRDTSLAEGIAVLGAMEEVELRNNWVSGLRVGYRLSSCHEGDGEPTCVSVSDCAATDCSIGLLLEQKGPSLPQRLVLDRLELSDSNYGLMMDSSAPLETSSVVQVTEVNYTNVALPALIHKNITARSSFCFSSNSFKHTLDFQAMDPPESDLRTKMFFYFATQKNIPYRVAYEKDQFVVIDDEESCKKLCS